MKKSDIPKNTYIASVYSQDRSNCTISVFPNPCSNYIKLHVTKKNNEVIKYELLNSSLEPLRIANTEKTEETIHLNQFGHYEDSYMLLIYINGLLIKSFRFDKIGNTGYLNQTKNKRSSKHIITENQ